MGPPTLSVYVGRIPEGTQPDDVEDLFAKYGVVEKVDLKAGFGFVLMERDAALEAIEKLNNVEFRGNSLLVSESRSSKDSRGGGGGEGRERSQWTVTRHNCILVENAFDTYWQNLKDLFNDFAPVLRAELQKDEDGRSRGVGFVEMKFNEDVLPAIKEFDGYTLSGHRLRLWPSPEFLEERDKGKGKGKGKSGGSGRFHPYERPPQDNRPRWDSPPRERSGRRDGEPRGAPRDYEGPPDRSYRGRDRRPDPYEEPEPRERPYRQEPREYDAPSGSRRPRAPEPVDYGDRRGYAERRDYGERYRDRDAAPPPAPDARGGYGAPRFGRGPELPDPEPYGAGQTYADFSSPSPPSRSVPYADPGPRGGYEREYERGRAPPPAPGRGPYEDYADRPGYSARSAPYLEDPAPQRYAAPPGPEYRSRGPEYADRYDSRPSPYAYPDGGPGYDADYRAPRPGGAPIQPYAEPPDQYANPPPRSSRYTERAAPTYPRRSEPYPDEAGEYGDQPAAEYRYSQRGYDASGGSGGRPSRSERAAPTQDRSYRSRGPPDDDVALDDEPLPPRAPAGAPYRPTGPAAAAGPPAPESSYDRRRR